MKEVNRGKGQTMRPKSKEKTGRKKGRVASKVPKIEFNKKAIEGIKNRKKGHYKRGLKESKRGK